MAKLPRTFYFAYGANMSVQKLRQRIRSARFAATGRLDQYQVQFARRGRDGSGKCTIVADLRGGAYGVVYSMVEAERGRLDEAVGVGRGYDRLEDVVIRTEAGPILAFTYIAQPGFLNPTLRPFDWYRTHVVLGAIEHELPDHHIADLRARPHSPDPDRKRAEQELSIYPSELVEKAFA